MRDRLENNAWVGQLKSDLSSLQDFDEANNFAEKVIDNPLTAITHPRIILQFLNIDFSMLRSIPMTVQIPPLGQKVSTHGRLPKTQKTDMASGMYQCGYVLPDGKICQYDCETHKQLSLHRIRDSRYTGMVHVTSLARVPVCPWYSSPFSFLSSAKQHVEYCFNKEGYTTDLAIYLVATDEYVFCNFPICFQEFDNIYDYHQHIRKYAQPSYSTLRPNPSFSNRSQHVMYNGVVAQPSAAATPPSKRMAVRCGSGSTENNETKRMLRNVATVDCAQGQSLRRFRCMLLDCRRASKTNDVIQTNQTITKALADATKHITASQKGSRRFLRTLRHGAVLSK